MDRTGIAEAMTRTSLLVHASPRETFGMTTLEALASGNAGMGALGRAPERFADRESPALSAGEPENPGSGSPSPSSEVVDGEVAASEEDITEGVRRVGEMLRE